MVMIIDKLPTLKQPLNESFESQILSQASQLFQNYNVEFDRGNLLRAGVLGVNLSKIGNKQSQKGFFDQVYRIVKDVQGSQIDLQNCLTIAESLIYNKVFRVGELENQFEIICEGIGQAQLHLVPKIINLILYIQKS